MADIEEKAKAMDIKGAVATLIISAFGFVAALSWNNAIQGLINEFFPKEGGVIYSFVAAIVVTVIAVVVIFLISKYMTVSIRDTVRKNVLQKNRKINIREMYTLTSLF